MINHLSYLLVPPGFKSRVELKRTPRPSGVQLLRTGEPVTFRSDGSEMNGIVSFDLTAGGRSGLVNVVVVTQR